LNGSTGLEHINHRAVDGPDLGNGQRKEPKAHIASRIHAPGRFVCSLARALRDDNNGAVPNCQGLQATFDARYGDQKISRNVLSALPDKCAKGRHQNRDLMTVPSASGTSRTRTITGQS
jgi:hypothetical protein